MIRPAKHEDVARLIELGAMLHEASTYKVMSFNRVKTAAFLHQLIDGQGVIFVAQVGEEIVGGFAGAVSEQWFSDDLIAFDYSLFIEPGRCNGVLAIRLIQTFQEWARIKGAKQLHMGIGTGISVEGTTRLYESLGLKQLGPLMIKEL